MSLKEFIGDALCQPPDYTPYYVSQRLAEMHPDKSIVESQSWAFDLEEYAQDGHCVVVDQPSVHKQIITEWKGAGRTLERTAENGWANLLWRGQLIDVVFLKFTEGCYRHTQNWIIADTREIAETFFRAVCEWCSELRGEILVFQDGLFEKDQDLYRAIKSASFENLILPAAFKHEVRSDCASFFASREVYRQYGIPWKRGVLLIGPPGNGKTHTVKALINEMKQPCVYVKSFKSDDGPEAGIRAVFKRARQAAPCVLVLEDLDSLISNKARAFFLNELDGFGENNGLLVLATTNHPERLDTALINRPSRFDRKYFFALPVAAERQAYIAAWNQKLDERIRLSEPAVNLVAEQTEDFSFAYLKELFVASMMEWMVMQESGAMDRIMPERVNSLRQEMSQVVDAALAQSSE